MSVTPKKFNSSISLFHWLALSASFLIAIVLATSVVGEGSAFAGTTPTTVTFTSTNYTVNVVSNWTVGFSLSSGTGLAKGDYIAATFPAGFDVPQSPTVVLGSAFGDHYCNINSVSVTNFGSTTLAPTITVKLGGTGQRNNCAGTYWPGITTWTIDGITNPKTASSTETGYTQSNTIEPGWGTVNSPVTITGVIPSAPTNVTGTPDNGIAYGTQSSVMVSWTAPSVGGLPVLRYTVEYSSDGGSSWSTPTSVSTTHDDVTGLTSGGNYLFKVSATNSVGTGPFGVSTSEVEPYTVPQTLAAPTITVGNATLTVSWAPLATGNTPITGYTVLLWGVPYSFPATTTAWTFTSASNNGGIANGDWYHPVVLATNNSGNGVYSFQPPTSFPGFVPLAPPSVTITQTSSTTASVYWPFSVESSGNGGWVIESYTVTVTSPDAATQTIVTSSGHVHVINVGGLIPGDPYVFSVQANSANGSSAFTPSSTFTP